MRKRGFKVFPIDHEFNSHKQEVSTISLNFQNAKSQQLVEEMILENKPAALHSGVACGTCSRGRDKPLPSHLRKSSGHKLLTSQLQGDTTEMRKDETDSVGKTAKKSRKIVQSGGAINTTTVPEDSQEFGAPNGANKGNTGGPQTGHF